MKSAMPLVGTTMLSLLMGCSPYPYTGAVKKFSGGVATVGDALVTNEASLVEVRTAAGRYRRRDMPSRPRMAWSAGCLEPASSGQRCEQVERGARPDAAASQTVTLQTPVAAPPAGSYECPVIPGTGERPRAADKEEVVVTAAMIASTLKEYADALAAVTNAADRAALDAAVGDLSKSAGTLASTVGMAGGPAASAAIGAVVSASVSLVGWIVGQAEDARRLDALDAALRATCRPIQTLGAAAETLIATRRREIADYRLRSITVIQAGMGPGTSRGEYAARDTEVDALLAAGVRPPDPNDQPGTALRKAHDALVKAVTNREGQTMALIEAVGSFAEAAQKLKSALDKIP